MHVAWKDLTLIFFSFRLILKANVQMKITLDMLLPVIIQANKEGAIGIEFTHIPTSTGSIVYTCTTQVDNAHSHIGCHFLKDNENHLDLNDLSTLLVNRL